MAERWYAKRIWRGAELRKGKEIEDLDQQRKNLDLRLGNLDKYTHSQLNNIQSEIEKIKSKIGLK